MDKDGIQSIPKKKLKQPKDTQTPYHPTLNQPQMSLRLPFHVRERIGSEVKAGTGPTRHNEGRTPGPYLTTATTP